MGCFQAPLGEGGLGEGAPCQKHSSSSLHWNPKQSIGLRCLMQGQRRRGGCVNVQSLPTPLTR